MCELFGVTANRRIRINNLLKTFFGHSVEHRNGWGMAVLDDGYVSIEKEPVRALDSQYLKSRLNGRIETARFMAHIRKATVGHVNFDNTHPFTKRDEAGRTWVLVHNGTIFESPVLSAYQYKQEGTTDSERIVLYIADLAGRYYRAYGTLFDGGRRIRMVDEAIRAITPGNKVNLMIYDGEYLYVHKNEPGTLHMKKGEDGILFSTRTLDDGAWEEFPQNQLMVYKDGRLVYAGVQHSDTYIHDEEKMKILYFAYSGL